MRVRFGRVAIWLFLALLLSASALDGPAEAASRKRRGKRSPVKGPTHQSAIVIDEETGTVLFQKNETTPRAPASLVKMMLQLVVLEAIHAGEISLEDDAVVSVEATRVRGTRVRLRPGEVVSVRDLLYATALSSANDAATALAIRLCGSTDACVERMNRRTRELGMRQTRFVNVHGLDSSGMESISTAADLAVLARELVRTPGALHLSNTPQATIRGEQTIRSTNRLLGRFPGLDGLKTGFTRRAGFCLAATAERAGMRLISVVLGSSNSVRRFNESAHLLHDSFLRYQKIRIVSKGEDLGEDVLLRGGEGAVRLIAERDLDLVLPVHRRSELRVAVTAPPSTRAPVGEGWSLGRVQVLIGDSLAAECRALAAEAVPRAAASSPPYEFDFH